MSSGWVQRTLAELAVYQNGRVFKPADWTEIGLPIVRIAQITDPNAKPNHYDGEDVDNRHIIDNGDLLFSWSATLAVLKWNNGPAILNQHIFKVVENDGVCRDFLRHLLHHSLPALAERSHGSTMKHIRKGVLREHLVSIPPLPEQRKIAAILSSVDDAIEKTQAVIDQVQVVKRGLMQELLTRGLPGRHKRFKQTEIGKIPEEWDFLPLRAMAASDRGLQTGPFGSQLHASDYVINGVPVLMPQDMMNGYVSDAFCARIADERAAELSRHRVQAGDILFARRGDLGRAGLITQHEEGWLCGTGCLRFRPKNRTVSRYLRHWIAWSTSVRWLNKHAVGQTMLNLNTSILGSLPVALPCDAERSVIIGVLEAFDEQIRTLEQNTEGLGGVKSALMSILLTGELRVTPDAEVA